MEKLISSFWKKEKKSISAAQQRKKLKKIAQ